jgi:putative addiction module killer protein
MGLTLVEYVDFAGKSPFGRWFAGLNAPAAARVSTALYRLEQGNLSNAKSVGGGIHEYRIGFGVGYRIYFGRDGDELIILLGGSSKNDQTGSITNAKKAWLA